MTLSRKMNYNIQKVIKGVRQAVANMQVLNGVFRRFRKQAGNAFGAMVLLGASIRQYVATPANIKEVKRITRSIMALHAVSMGWLMAMIRFSPALSAEVGLVRFEFELMFLEIGNAIAPILKPFLQKLRDIASAIRDLPEPVQQFIGLMIVFTAVLTAAAIAMAALSAVSLPVVAVILAIAAAIAAIIVIWKNWNKIVEWFNRQGVVMKVIILTIGLAFAAIVAPILIIIAVVKFIIWLFQNFGEVTLRLKELFGAAWDFIVGALKKAADFIRVIIENIKSFFSSLFGVIVDTAGNAWENLKLGVNRVGEWISDKLSKAADGIKNAFQQAVDQIAGFFKKLFGDTENQSSSLAMSVSNSMTSIVKGYINSLIQWINSQIVTPVNNVINSLKGYSVGDVKPFGGLTTLSRIPQLAVGTAYVPQDMIAMLHKGEMVVPKPYAEEMRKGTGSINLNFEIKIENPMFRDEWDVESMAEDLVRKASERIMDMLNKSVLWSG